MIGDLVRCRDPNPPSGATDPDGAALATVIERLHAQAIPIAAGAPVGHGDRNEAIPFGARCEVAFGPDDAAGATLSILEPAVR